MGFNNLDRQRYFASKSCNVSIRYLGENKILQHDCCTSRQVTFLAVVVSDKGTRRTPSPLANPPNQRDCQPTHPYDKQIKPKGLDNKSPIKPSSIIGSQEKKG